MAVKTSGVITLIRVDDGAPGTSGIIVSSTAPTSPVTGQLWQSTSTGIIKKWSGSAWTIWYMDVTNLSVENLTAISAKLGKFSVTDAGLQYGDMSSLGSLISATDTEFSIGVKTAAINGTSSITIGNTSNLGLSGLFGANKKAMLLSSDYFYFSGVSYLAGNTTISGSLDLTGDLRVTNKGLKVPPSVSGTIVKQCTGDASLVLFTKAQVDAMFGITTSNTNNYVAVATNGDGSTTASHIHGTTWLGHLYVLFDRPTSSLVRINYIIFYTG